MSAAGRRDRLVRRVILIEGVANLGVLAVKLVAGLTTGSLAILSDAVHSLTDVVNNLVAWVVVTMSGRPADREHPYGHRKFETLAVFALATLLMVLAVELALHALRRDEPQVELDRFSLALMLGVLGINIALATWQRRWALRLRSDILLADANHTFGDVLTTVVVIVGWQLSARGHPWLDTACALGVALLVAYLAVGLFRRVIPVLIDRIAIEPERVIDAALEVRGVRRVRRVRSRSGGAGRIVDMIVAVEPGLSTTQSHAIADDLEKRLKGRFGIDDVTVHVEPDTPRSNADA